MEGFGRNGQFLTSWSCHFDKSLEVAEVTGHKGFTVTFTDLLATIFSIREHNFK